MFCVKYHEISAKPALPAMIDAIGYCRLFNLCVQHCVAELQHCVAAFEIEVRTKLNNPTAEVRTKINSPTVEERTIFNSPTVEVRMSSSTLCTQQWLIERFFVISKVHANVVVLRCGCHRCASASA